MIGSTVESALGTLRAEREKIERAIETLEGLLRSAGGTSKAGRGAALASAVTARRHKGGPRRKNAPRGLLIKSIREILKAQKKPMAPVDLRNTLIKNGYPNRNERTLYTAIFAATKKKDSGVKKSAAGFELK